MLKPRRLNRREDVLASGERAGGGVEILELDQIWSPGFHQPTMSRAADPAGIIG